MNFLSHGEYGEELSLVIELIGITLRNLSSSFSLMRLFDVVSFSLLKAFLLSTTKVIENKHEALEALYYLTLSNTKNFEQVHDENATVPHNADVGGLMESFRLLFSQALELSDAELQLVFMKALLSYMTAELNSLLKGSNHSEIVDSFRKLLIDAFDTIFLPLEHLLANADLLSLYIENINLLTLNFTEIHWLEDLIFLGYLGVFLYSSSNVGLHFDLLKDHLCLLSRVVCYSSPWKTLPATETRAQWIVDSIAQGLPFLPKGVNYIEVYRNMSPGARYEKALLSLMHCFMQGTGIGFKSSELIQMVADSTICYMKKCLFQEDIHYLSALDLFSKCAMDGILISSLPDFERLNHVTLSVLDYSKHLVSWVFSYDHICIQTRLCLALYLMANFQYCSDTTVSQSRVCGKNNLPLHKEAWTIAQSDTGQFLEQPVETLTVLLCFHETFHRHCFLELLIELILSRNTMFSLPAINFFRKIMECFLQVSSPKKLFFEIFEKHSFESILCSCCFSYLRQYPLIAAFYERLEVLNEMSEHDLLSVIKALICCFQFFEVTYVPTSAISKLCYIVERKSLDSEVTEYIILFFHFLIECSANDVQKKVYIQLIGNKRIINIFFKTLLYKDKFGAKSSWLVLLLLTDFLHLSRKFNISKTSEATSHFSEIPVRSLLPKLLSIRVPIVEATMNFLSEVLSLRETETESSEDFPFRINFPFGPFFMRWRFREVREVLWIALNKFHDCEDLLGASIFCIIKICESVKKELLAQNAWLWYAVRSFIEGVTERSHQLSTEIVFGLNKLLSIFTIDESAEDLVTMWKAYLASLMTDAEEEKIQPLSQTEYDLLLKDLDKER
ncbi:uncharacterized protein LOC135120620 [Zophobas morio]|uniref:uncharacterized protein LOC135120620 n=1 Tax=Zophobas morio TaxID=2755281 RepID=UPI0030836A58